MLTRLSGSRCILKLNSLLVHRAHDVSEVIFFSVYVFTSSKAWRLEYICMCYDCLPMCLWVAPMHCVCGQVCSLYAMSVLAMDMFCVYVRVCACVYLRVCEGLPAQGIGWIVSTCVLIQSAGWVRGTWVCVWVEVWGWGGSGFIAPSTAFGPLNTKLKFPRLPAHTPHTLCVDTMHGNMAKHSLWQTPWDSE